MTNAIASNKTVEENGISVKIVAEIIVAISKLATFLTFILGSVIQIIYLYKYNGLAYFSISQTAIDILVLAPYLLFFLLIPLLLTVMSTGELDKMRSKTGIIMLVLGVISMFFITFGPIISLMLPLLDNMENPKPLFITLGILAYILLFLLSNLGIYKLLFHQSNEQTQIWRKKISYRELFISIIIYLVYMIYLRYISFSINITNISLNSLFFSTTCAFYARIIYLLSNLKPINKEQKKHKKFNDEKELSTKEILTGFIMCVYLISFMIAPMFYLKSLFNHITNQYNDFGYAIVDDKRENILYKNDKYIVTQGGSSGEIKFIPENKIEYYITKENQSLETLEIIEIKIKIEIKKIFENFGNRKTKSHINMKKKNISPIKKIQCFSEALQAPLNNCYYKTK